MLNRPAHLQLSKINSISYKLSFFFIIVQFLFGWFLRAEDIIIPDQELSRESVLPVFDIPNSVRNRNVVLKNKIEVGVFGGAVTDEAIYSSNHFGFLTSYHFDEIHSVNFMFGQHMEGMSSYSEQLKSSSVNLDFSKTYPPKSYMLLNYQFMGYYGKFSILKNYNYNFHVFGIGGLGTVNYDGLQEIALNFGLGQRLYITPNIGLKIEYRFLRFNGPNPVSISDKAKLKSGTLSISEYSSTTHFQNHITLGLIALF